MATLVLSTVGTLLGGPVGGAIGSLLGESIDQQLFGPGPRQGPRLGDLSVQTSNYGRPIPRVFGTMRVAGSIIWSTDLQEDSQTQGAKGQPDTTTYSYSVSFAVALSSRPITSIGRIWADGKLIRGTDGQFTVPMTFRLYDGSEEQAIDPLIASIEGLESTPAYRGVALAVFEQLQLAEFGNRIPFLTFEVEADLGPVPLDVILADASAGAISSSLTETLPGYAAYGATIDSAVEPLVELFGIAILEDGDALVSPSNAVLDLSRVDVGCAADSEPKPRAEQSQEPARNVPSRVSLSYYDPQREYQVAVAKASLDAAPEREQRLELPAVLQAVSAKALAETSLGRRWAERDKLTLRLPPSQLGLRPGTVILAQDGEPWRVERLTIDRLAVIADLRPTYGKIASVPADPGRIVSSAGVVPAPTTTAVFELAADEMGNSDSPVVVASAVNYTGSWRAVPLQVQVEGGESEIRVAGTAAIMGSAQTSLDTGQSAVIDRLNSVDVQLANADQWLESCDYRALANGSNLALLGSELIQFGDALPLGSGQFRLSSLLRGRRGTEWAMALHEAGETFVLLDLARLTRLPVTSAQVGATIQVKPLGLADADADACSLSIAGEAMRPPSPVHLRASLRPDGGLDCSWVRRSRFGWSWLDGVDAALGCSIERYRVALQGAATPVEVETASPDFLFTAADLARAGEGDLILSVRQVGDFAVSRPALLTITIN
jgi:hypothetical protein